MAKIKPTVRRLQCRECGDISLIPMALGRPPSTCKWCIANRCKKRTGRGNIKPRPCGCPARQHRPDCEHSRPYDWAGHKTKRNRRVINQRNRRLKAKIAARTLTIGTHDTMRVIPPAMRNMPVYLTCVGCRGRGLMRDFREWNPETKEGICKNC